MFRPEVSKLFSLRTTLTLFSNPNDPVTQPNNLYYKNDCELRNVKSMSLCQVQKFNEGHYLGKTISNRGRTSSVT